MRIAGGKYKGRIFNPGKSFKARPTTDLAKESLFNILTNRYSFEECDVLDLFSGTGSIGYEFLSRGCASVTMVEINNKHIAFIKTVLNNLNEQATIVNADAFKYVKSCARNFDLVFADPPYDHPNFMGFAELVVSSSIVKPGGTLIIEHSKAYDFSSFPHFCELRRYGHVHFSFFNF